jgi:hypothetical protein
MVGAAAESLILELRDVVRNRMKRLKQREPKGFGDWRVKVVLDALYAELDSRRDLFPKRVEG